MTQQMISGIIPLLLFSFTLSSNGQQPAFNQNSARSNHPKAMSTGTVFQLTPQYGVNLKGNTIDSLLFRGNGSGFKMDAGYSFGNFGIGIASGFVSSQTDKTKINEFLTAAGLPPGQMLISTGNQQNMYVLLGPSAEFGKKIQASLHAKGGLFINNGGFVNIRRQGAANSLYRNEPSSKSLFPGFSTGLNLNYQVSDLISIGFGADYLNTKSEVVNYDIRKSGGAVAPEAIRLSKNISNLMAGITVRYGIKSPKDAPSGQSAGKQLGKPKYDDIKSRDVSAGQSSGKTYQPGKPVFGNKTINESCGLVTMKKTNTDGSTEEMTFACPDDAATYNQRSGDISERPVWTTSDSKKSFVIPHVLDQKGSISGRVSWTTSNPGVGIVTNRTVRGGGIRITENQGATRTTPSTSFGTIVRISARETSSGMATGRRQYEPVFDEGQGEVCNPCLLTVKSNPLYTDKAGVGNNPLYEAKTRIADPGDCDDNDPGIANLKVSLVNDITGQVVATTQTEKCGDFFFANVPSGDYTIQLSGMLTGKKGYDFYKNSKIEAEGQIVWGGESVNLIIHSTEEKSGPSQRAGISTSRSNLRNKSLTVIDADTDGDGAFDSYRVIGGFSDGRSVDYTEEGSATRVNKVDAITIKQKALQTSKSFASKLGAVAKGVALTGITVASGDINADGIANERKVTANFSDGSSWDVTPEAQINTTNSKFRQFTIIVADLDDDGMADAILKQKTKSNQSNDRIMSVDEGTIYAIAVGDLDGDGKTEAAINTSHSNIKNLNVTVVDVDGDGVAEAAINTSHSNIKNMRVSTGDVDGDGKTDFIAGGSLPGGAVISAALRSPGDPIPGLDVKLSKKGGANERTLTSDENGKIKIIGPDLEPDTYEMSINTNFILKMKPVLLSGDGTLQKKRLRILKRGQRQRWYPKQMKE